MLQPDPGRETAGLGQAGLCIKFMSLFGSFPLELSPDIVCCVSPVRASPISLFEMFQQETGTVKQIDVYQHKYLFQPFTGQE